MKLIPKGQHGLINDRTDHPIERPIIIEPIERVIGPADRVNVPKGTKYSELTPQQKLELHKSDALKRDSKQLEITSPEFDVLTLLTGTKSARNLLDIARRKKTYTGVPHDYMYDRDMFKDEVFLTSKDKFDIWTSDNYNFVQQFAKKDGQTFAVFGRPDKLYKLPKLRENYPVLWTDMPYVIKGKKIKVNKNKLLVKSEFYPKEIWRTFDGERLEEINPTEFPGRTTTGKLFWATSGKHDGIKFKNVFDGPVLFNELTSGTPVNEWVYKAGANVIKAPIETTKLDLINLDDVIDVTTRSLTPVGRNLIGNDK